MPTFASPVTLEDFQRYIKDDTSDADLVAFYVSLLQIATEFVYTWLDRDLTPESARTDRFLGTGSRYHATLGRVGALTGYAETDAAGETTVLDPDELLVRLSGSLIESRTGPFRPGVEYAINYTQPTTPDCPETVRQVIIEIATRMLDESRLGSGSLGVRYSSTRELTSHDRVRYRELLEEHHQRLRPYKRYPV